MEAIAVRKSRRLLGVNMIMWYGFCNILNNLVYLHVFVSTQGSQVVFQGVLTEEWEEKEAEVHDWASWKAWRACEFLTYFYIFWKPCLLYLRTTLKIGTKLCFIVNQSINQ